MRHKSIKHKKKYVNGVLFMVSLLCKYMKHGSTCVSTSIVFHKNLPLFNVNVNIVSDCFLGNFFFVLHFIGRMLHDQTKHRNTFLWINNLLMWSLKQNSNTIWKFIPNFNWRWGRKHQLFICYILLLAFGKLFIQSVNSWLLLDL